MWMGGPGGGAGAGAACALRQWPGGPPCGVTKPLARMRTTAARAVCRRRSAHRARRAARAISRKQAAEQSTTADRASTWT